MRTLVSIKRHPDALAYRVAYAGPKIENFTALRDGLSVVSDMVLSGYHTEEISEVTHFDLC